jgi:hypothetical protein
MKRVLLITTLGLMLASSAMADMTDCRFAMHYQALVTKNFCTTSSPTGRTTPLPCGSYTVTGPAAFTNVKGMVYVVIAKAGLEGVNGASFGVDYSGIPGDPLNPGVGHGIDPNIVTWNLCTDGLGFPNAGPNGDFPKPGGGIRITWVTCATQVVAPYGVNALCGWFYIYSYASNSQDVLKMTPNNNLASGVPELAVNSCASQTTDLYQQWGPVVVQQILGTVGVGGATGYNPCLVTPLARETTWGRIKSQFKN